MKTNKQKIIDLEKTIERLRAKLCDKEVNRALSKIHDISKKIEVETGVDYMRIGGMAIDTLEKRVDLLILQRNVFKKTIAILASENRK